MKIWRLRLAGPDGDDALFHFTMKEHAEETLAAIQAIPFERDDSLDDDYLAWSKEFSANQIQYHEFERGHSHWRIDEVDVYEESLVVTRVIAS